MDLLEVSTPAVSANTVWRGQDTFTLQSGDALKIESDGVEHLSVPVPQGETRTFTITISIDD